MNRIGLVALVGCAVAGSLAVAGCGGGGSTNATTTTAAGTTAPGASKPLSQSEFVSQASAACKDGNDKIEALKAPPSNPTAKDLADLTGQTITIANGVYSKLSAITPPSNLKDQYDAYLANTKSSIGIAGQVQDAASSGDTSQLKTAVQKLAVANKAGDDQAKELGLDECARDVHPQG